MSNFKVTINGVEQQGIYSPEECGDKTCQLLRMMGSVTVDYERVNDDYDASSKKSKTQPKSFSEMVKEQREKNIHKSDEDEGETEYRETLQELYRVIAPKIKETSDRLVNTLEQVRTYETVGDFGGSEGHVIDDCIFRMRELLDSLEEGIESANNDFW